MANDWHVKWLKEGVKRWNKRRKRVDFQPDLSGLRFFDCLPRDYRDTPKTSRTFEKIDLSGANLHGSDLSDLNFSGANFSNTDFGKADMSLSNFENAKFENSDLSGCNLQNSLLNGALFIRSRLVDALVENADVSRADFVETDIDNVSGVFKNLESSSRYSSIALFISTRKSKILEDNSDQSSVPKPKSDKYKPERKHKYEVFYGTNRKAFFQRDSLVGFLNEESSNISLGICEVSLPKHNPIGKLSRSPWKMFQNTKSSGFSILSIMELNADLFFGKVISQLERDCAPTIFIHGYATSFDDAVIKTARLGRDIGLSQGIGLFSWPSANSKRKYGADEVMVERSKYALADFIAEFVANNKHGRVNLIAHSMGCRLLASSLELLRAKSPNVLGGINEVVFAAADVDQSVLGRVVDGFSSLVVRTTAYVSGKDFPLWFSRFWHTYDRVGLFPPVFEHQRVDTIKVVPDDFLTFYHSYVSEDRPVLSDLHYVLKEGLAPDRRHGMVRDSMNVWTMVP